MSTRVGIPQTNASAVHNFEVCSHFLKGNCRFGDSCVRLHPVCAFWNHAGRCLKGDNCNYRHTSDEEEFKRLFAARQAAAANGGSPTPAESPEPSSLAAVSSPIPVFATAAAAANAAAPANGKRRFSASQRSFLVYCLLENKDLESPRKKMHTTFFEKIPQLPDGHRLLHEFLLLEDSELVGLLLQERIAETAQFQKLLDESVSAFWKDAAAAVPTLRKSLAITGVLGPDAAAAAGAAGAGAAQAGPQLSSSPKVHEIDPSKVREFVPGAFLASTQNFYPSVENQLIFSPQMIHNSRVVSN